MPGRADDLDEVVRRHVGGHADGDAAGAVHQQVRVGGGKHLGLSELVVVVRHEVDDVFVEAFGHRQGGRGQACLGVPRGGRAVVERAEVAVPVDERHAQREVLRHAHEGVVDRRVAVRVQLAHDLADDTCGLDVAAIGPQAHLGHLVEDAPLHGLQAVASVGQGPRVDDRVCVLEERALHLCGDVDIFDAFDDRLVCGRVLGSGHPCSLLLACGARGGTGARPACARLGAMSAMLPVPADSAGRLAAVLDSSLASVAGEPNELSPAAGTQRGRGARRRARCGQHPAARGPRALPRIPARQARCHPHGVPVDDGGRARELHHRSHARRARTRRATAYSTPTATAS